jgi:hypothetical protein
MRALQGARISVRLAKSLHAALPTVHALYKAPTKQSMVIP